MQFCISVIHISGHLSTRQNLDRTLLKYLRYYVYVDKYIDY
jgi:hypothetical protein